MRLIILLILLNTLIINNIAYSKPPIFLSSVSDAQKISQDLNLPILTIVSADWCLYCGMLDKTISNNLDVFENIIILKIDFDSNKEYVEKYHIKKIPVIIYNNKQYIGIYDINTIKQLLKK